jgi:hypothetical protein
VKFFSKAGMCRDELTTIQYKVMRQVVAKINHRFDDSFLVFIAQGGQFLNRQFEVRSYFLAWRTEVFDDAHLMVALNSQTTSCLNHCLDLTEGVKNPRATIDIIAKKDRSSAFWMNPWLNFANKGVLLITDLQIAKPHQKVVKFIAATMQITDNIKRSSGI